jgi:DNA-binding phage protein
MKRLKTPKGAARYLTKMLTEDEPANVQGALNDVVRAQGGVRATAKRAGLAEWRLRLMLWDEEEALKLVRLAGLMKALGLRLTARPEGK